MSGAETLAAVRRERHGSVTIGHGTDLAAAAMLGHVPLGFSEIPLAVCDYPIVFIKDGATGAFRLVALLGFAANRNLFVIGGSWAATYLPLNVLRLPFYLGAPDGGELELCIDEGSSLIGGTPGNALFEASGSETAFLAGRRTLLNTMLADAEKTARFVSTVTAARLVTPMTITLHHADQRQQDIAGAYTIDPLALESLDGETLQKLHRDGHLGAIYAVMHSLGQLTRLEQLHNAHGEHPIARSAVQLHL
ncbi:SapC family protein [Novosphingobium sediminis]|uniref:SapC family protein n=1 Tax=Novosphingobium sediminis TaxID=707214 RepID=A0A512APH1_9SPHN|nr:SapC family protein [Novosphingobium sediminis]GEO01605.1 SapC family protein [Novosphingobium sediminis]